MRVEAAPHVFRNEDRRQRAEDRRNPGDDRRIDPDRSTTRAQHASMPWFAPVFGAHLLGQSRQERVSPREAKRAYLQPETKTPLRPSCVQEV